MCSLRGVQQPKVFLVWLQSDCRADKKPDLGVSVLVKSSDIVMSTVSEDESSHRRYQRDKIDLRVVDLLRGRIAHRNCGCVSGRHGES